MYKAERQSHAYLATREAAQITGLSPWFERRAERAKSSLPRKAAKAPA